MLTTETDFHADTSKVDYIMPEFDHFWETKYGVTDSNFPTCDVDRPSGGDTAKLMGIMNHMLNYAIGDIVIPNQLAAKKTNSLQSINKQVGLCVKQHKVKPSVVLVSFLLILFCCYYLLLTYFIVGLGRRGRC